MMERGKMPGREDAGAQDHIPIDGHNKPCEAAFSPPALHNPLPPPSVGVFPLCSARPPPPYPLTYALAEATPSCSPPTCARLRLCRRFPTFASAPGVTVPKNRCSKPPGSNLTGFGKFRGRIDRFIAEG
jgi:hypothetical protein